MITASTVPTVSATATRITAAIVAPTCGIRSSRPVMTPSTTGNGRPRIHAEKPAIKPATTEIATLPISDDDTVVIASSTVGFQRASTDGGVKPNSQSVIVGRSISRKSARNVSVTSDSTPPNTLPATPSRALAASGRPEASSLSVDLTCSSALAVERKSWKPGFEVSLSHIAGSWWTNSTIWSHTGPAVTSTSANTPTNSAANTSTEARPRFHPRRTSAPTTGSRPTASTAARRIDISVPSDSSASATSAANPSSCSSVRAGIESSTRWRGGAAPPPPPGGGWWGGGPRHCSGAARGGERLGEALLGLVVQRRLDDAARDLDPLEHLVHRHAPDQRDDGGAARRQLLPELLHELVVDARVGEGARRRTAGGADRHAEQWHQEDEADQAAPQRAAGRAGARHRGLMELDLAVFPALDDDEVVELDLVRGLRTAEV